MYAHKNPRGTISLNSKSMLPRSAIQKGKELEDFIAEELRASGIDPRAQRQKGSGNGLFKGDIWNDVGLCIEAKNTKTLFLMGAWHQAVREAMGTQEPVVVWHHPFTPLGDSKVIISWEYFKALVKNKQDNQGKGEILEKWQVKNHLQQAVQHLKQVIKNL